MAIDLKLFSLLKGVQLNSNKKIKPHPNEWSVVVASSLNGDLQSELSALLAPWQLKRLQHKTSANFDFETADGPLSVIVLKKGSGPYGSSYAVARDELGKFFCRRKPAAIKSINFYERGLKSEELLGALVGLEVAAYNFKDVKKFPRLKVSNLSEVVQRAQAIGGAVNLARHLVNIPAADKRPVDYAKAVEGFFADCEHMTVNIWDEKRLKREGMGMILAVGQGAFQPPRLVHLSYRPPGKKKQSTPIAFVGKGITFDSGGLNIKVGNYMRLMKKDMGGSATLMGLAAWLSMGQQNIPCDFYLALAENAVDSLSFRPGDILRAQNGLTVEIDNTDAEGRLVLGDVMGLLAQKEGSERPKHLIDVATLTGAIKAGLGSDVGGLFANDQKLSDALFKASKESGDPLWPMPLLDSQRAKLKSDVADLKNCAPGYGGAITAAMFLKEFVGKLSWAHLDIYAWKDSAAGPFCASGGSGQAVQALIFFINRLSGKSD